MYFYDTQRLVRLAVEHGILHSENGGVAIYRKAGPDPKQSPEGWYLELPDDVAHDLMDDAEGQRCLIEALAEKGIVFREEGPDICTGIDELLSYTGNTIHFEERRLGEFWAIQGKQ